MAPVSTLVGWLARSEFGVSARLRVIDSHTAGEPTRVVVSGGPDLGGGSMAERRRRFQECHDDVRRAVIREPRGSDALVGALLCPAADPDCAAGVVFFNNVGYLGMCGHGAIGVAVTLAYLKRVELGPLRLETPVGVVSVHLTSPNEATVENVESYCWRRGVAVDVDGIGLVRGDIAWGGNWFFIVHGAPRPLTLQYATELADFAKRVKGALAREAVTGANGAEIDHIELFEDAHAAAAHGRNFVLCPGDAYDRSPCGTGTSAKIACLAESGDLLPGDAWVQESVIGSRFTGRYRRSAEGKVIPSITGEAFVCADATLIRQPDDPFKDGIG